VTELRAGAVPTVRVGREEPHALDLLDVRERGQADAAAYEAWLDAGKPREVIETKPRERAPYPRHRFL
jgi:hypothetical protein